MSLVPIDEVVHFDVCTHNPSTGAVSDADSTPTFAVFEEATDTAILDAQNFTKRTSLTGNYRGSFTASAANGFEAGKWYNVIASATVNSVAAKAVAMRFRVAPAESQAGVPKSDLAYWLGTAPLALASQMVQVSVGALQSAVITTASIADGALTAAKFASGAFDAVWSVTTRLLTAGTNIVLAKGVGVTGFNDLSEAQVNTQADTALADAGVTTTRTGYLDNLSAGAVATAAKLLSYFQSALRKDVTVDADIGGNYDDATDSQEAIRDRGDAAWTTATGFSTHSAADVWAVTTRELSAFSSSFKTGYALSSAGVQAIWDALTSALTTLSSIGKLLVDNINATIGSRSSHSAADVASQITSDHGSGSYVRNTEPPTAVQVRQEIDANSTKLDVAVSTRATPAQVATELQTYDAPTKAELDAAITSVLDAIADLDDLDAGETGDAVLDEVVEGSTTVRQMMRGFAAALLAKANGLDTNTARYRDLADSKDRIIATVDEFGNRSAVTRDLT